MKNLLLGLASVAAMLTMTPAFAADAPNKRTIYLPVAEYYRPAWNVDVGYMRGINSKSDYAYGRLSYDYKDFVPFVEYGYSTSDNQYLSGGLGYNIIYRNLTVRPNVKAGYNWDQGKFIAPSVEVAYKLTDNLSLTSRYDYVMKEHNKFDHRVGGGLTLKF